MAPALLKHSLWSFAMPGIWIVVAAATLVVGRTQWGISGHPSNGLLMLLTVLFAAPLFGIVGGAYAVFSKTHQSRLTKGIAVTLNVGLVGLGVFIWLFWFL
jgi:hypothetical protein